jgi:transposase-like protein/transposase Tn5 family protein
MRMSDDRDLHYMNFGDPRLTGRLEKMLDDFTDNPSASIPQACQSLAATKAAYRFFSNENVEAETIRKGFYRATIDRIVEKANNKVVMFASDATNLVFTSHKKLKGIGVLRNQKAKGLNLHTTLAFTENEVTLGIVHQHCWGRKPEDYGQRAIRAKKPIEEKESFRWIESFRAAQESLPNNTRGIFLGDRGADIYELFLEPRKENMHILIRALHNRQLTDSSEKMFQELENTSNAGIMEVLINRSGERKERTAQLKIHYKNISIKPPKDKKHLSSISITMITAKEVTENGEIQDAVDWKLLTTLPITSIEHAIYTVTTYAKRWLIERYHYVLKQGCQVEELQLEEADRIDKAVAVYTILACRIMHITYLARVSPDLPCTEVFDDDEWRALYCYANKTSKEPTKPMTLHEAIMMLAKIGGFLGRKRDGYPGVKVLWRGMQILEGAAEMFRILRGKRCG